MRLANIIVGGVVLLMSLVFYISAGQLPEFTLKLAGPDFFPRVIAALQAIIAIWIIKLNIIRWRKPSPEVPAADDNIRIVLLAIFLTLIYYFLLDIVGFWLDTFVYSFSLSLLTQTKRRFIPAGLTSLGLICIIYLLFSVLLKASLPTGILF